jgi:hypothetical protein
VLPSDTLLQPSPSNTILIPFAWHNHRSCLRWPYAPAGANRKYHHLLRLFNL